VIGAAVLMQQAGNGMMMDVAGAVAAASGNPGLSAQIPPTFTPLQAPTGDPPQAQARIDPFNVARAYLTKTVIECQKDLYVKLAALNFFIEPASTISLETLHFEAIGGGLAFGGFVSSFHYLANGMVYLALFEYVQYYLLTLAQYTMLPIFLPIGLILRSFPVTRGAGGLVTAFALGFAFVFPITYVLSIAVMPGIGSACNSVNVTFTDENPCYYNEGEIQQHALEIRSKSDRINLVVDDARGKISLLYLQAFFYPMVSLIVTFTFIRQTSSLLGSDLAEIGRGLIKII